MQRRQVVEEDLVLGVFRRLEVDRFDLEQREIALGLLGRSDQPRDGVTGAQVEASDLTRRDIDVVRACQVGARRRAQEAEAVLQDLEDALDVFALLGLGLQYGEDLVLLAHTVDAVDLHRARHVRKLRGGLSFELSEAKSHSISGTARRAGCAWASASSL